MGVRHLGLSLVKLLQHRSDQLGLVRAVWSDDGRVLQHGGPGLLRQRGAEVLHRVGEAVPVRQQAPVPDHLQDQVRQRPHQGMRQEGHFPGRGNSLERLSGDDREEMLAIREDVCQPKMEDFTRTFNWTSERLVGGSEERQLCAKVRKCNIEEKTRTKVTKVPERKCENIPYNRQVCRPEAVPQPPQMTTQYKTEYRQQCYNVPKPVCKMRPCQYAVQTQQICPITNQPISSGSPCGGGDSCGGGGGCGGGPAPAPDMCGACRQQNVQMCTKMTQQCETVMEKVCQQVPIRVPVQISIPSPPRYVQKCDTVTESREQCRTIYVDKTEEVPIKTCNNVLVEKCQPYSVPSTEVVTEQMNGDQTFTGIKTCTIATETAEHCAMLPVKEVCQPRTVRRRVKIQTTVCDRKSYKKECKNFPDEVCRNSAGQVCQNVPREVCQPSCPQTNLCNSCQNFAGTGGFEQCQQPTCPNFIN